MRAVFVCFPTCGPCFPGPSSSSTCSSSGWTCSAGPRQTKYKPLSTHSSQALQIFWLTARNREVSPFVSRLLSEVSSFIARDNPFSHRAPPLHPPPFKNSSAPASYFGSSLAGVCMCVGLCVQTHSHCQSVGGRGGGFQFLVCRQTWAEPDTTPSSPSASSLSASINHQVKQLDHLNI